MLAHNYTSNFVDTAAVTVNAGTCLEDGNSHLPVANVFDSIGKAVNEVQLATCTIRN